MRPEEAEVSSFVHSLFVQQPSPYRKTVVNSQEEVDARAADKILQDANKIPFALWIASRLTIVSKIKKL